MVLIVGENSIPWNTNSTLQNVIFFLSQSEFGPQGLEF